MIERRQRHAGADAQPLCARRRHCAHQMHRRAHAEAAEMVLGEPHRVVAGAVHDLDPLERAGEHRFERHAPFRPAEELQDAELHRAARRLLFRLRGYSENASVALNAARAGTTTRAFSSRPPATPRSRSAVRATDPTFSATAAIYSGRPAGSAAASPNSAAMAAGGASSTRALPAPITHFPPASETLSGPNRVLNSEAVRRGSPVATTTRAIDCAPFECACHSGRQTSSGVRCSQK